jgi:hypothetical protein
LLWSFGGDAHLNTSHNLVLTDSAVCLGQFPVQIFLPVLLTL